MKDEIFMKKALRLAVRGVGKTSPNPMVGALVVRGRKILGKGYHRRYGEDHAEVIALKNAKGVVRGTSMYVTLEPCCHHGWTPPCVDALIGAGIGRVVIGTPDPNPKVSGRGIQILRDRGIRVKVGVLEERCRKLNEAYFKFIQTGIPFVTLKFAQSLDGRIATKTGNSQWISSPETLRLAHRMRSIHDGVLVGIGTALADDPSLTVRLVKGNNPQRIIVDGRLRMPLTAKVLNDEMVDRTIIAVEEGANQKKARDVQDLGAEILWVARNRRGELDLNDLLKQLGKMGVTSILVEGGARVITSFLRERLVDKIIIVIAPKLIGEGIEAIRDLEIRELDDAMRIFGMKTRRLGEDIIIEGYLREGNG